MCRGSECIFGRGNKDVEAKREKRQVSMPQIFAVAPADSVLMSAEEGGGALNIFGSSELAKVCANAFDGNQYDTTTHDAVTGPWRCVFHCPFFFVRRHTFDSWEVLELPRICFANFWRGQRNSVFCKCWHNLRHILHQLPAFLSCFLFCCKILQTMASNSSDEYPDYTQNYTHARTLPTQQFKNFVWAVFLCWLSPSPPKDILDPVQVVLNFY